MYVLVQDGRVISKPHSTELACLIEAYERGLAFASRHGKHLMNGVEAVELNGATNGDALTTMETSQKD